eukprot:TRINITY_DN2876_c0_g1_i2.p1 TRINITY_DN2876_c0_g1~~TRINITY_DN2876_c0_g1_i2.p1  ORF type:complete len:417 (+),score=136.64 TRINITY_DN2876_c0_g1_i2:23-1252(+)
MADKIKKGHKGPKRSNFILCIKIHDKETVAKFEQIQSELNKAMRINKNKLTSAAKFHVTLLVLRIQNTAEYKELIGILQQAESIFRKYFDDQTIELQLKQVPETTETNNNINEVNSSSDNIINDNHEDEDSNEESDEDESDDEDEESEDENEGGQAEDLEKIKTVLKVTEKPVLRFQNVGHFYGSGKCIVWIGLKDDKHKVMLEHLAHELFKHVKKSNSSFLIEGSSSRFHPHVTLYKNKIEKSAKEVKGKSPLTPKKLANFCTKWADVDFGEQSIDKIIINVKIGSEEEDPDGFYKTYLSVQLEPSFALNIDIEEVAPLDAVWKKQQAKLANKASEESDESDESNEEEDREESEESDEDSDKPKFTNWTKQQKKGLEQMDSAQDRRQKKFNSQQQRNKARRQKNQYDD